MAWWMLAWTIASSVCLWAGLLLPSSEWVFLSIVIVVGGLIVTVPMWRKQLSPDSGTVVWWLLVVALIWVGCGAIRGAIMLRITPRSHRYAGVARDLANLKGIGCGLQMFESDMRSYPNDPRRLVQGHYVPPEILVSPYSGNEASEESDSPYTGPCDYRYINLPVGAPDDLIWTLGEPEWYRGGEIPVLRKGGRTELLSCDQSVEELLRTARWLGQYEARRAAETMPDFLFHHRNSQMRSDSAVV